MSTKVYSIGRYGKSIWIVDMGLKFDCTRSSAFGRIPYSSFNRKYKNKWGLIRRFAGNKYYIVHF